MTPTAVFLLALLQQQAGPSDLGVILVEAHRTDPLVSVTVSGDIGVETIVESDPVGVRCGISRYTYAPYAAPRLCWIRRPAGQVVRLTARPGHEMAANWSVNWQGCTVQADGRSCLVNVTSQGAKVEVAFQTSATN